MRQQLRHAAKETASRDERNLLPVIANDIVVLSAKTSLSSSTSSSSSLSSSLYRRHQHRRCHFRRAWSEGGVISSLRKRRFRGKTGVVVKIFYDFLAMTSTEISPSASSSGAMVSLLPLLSSSLPMVMVPLLPSGRSLSLWSSSSSFCLSPSSSFLARCRHRRCRHRRRLRHFRLR